MHFDRNALHFSPLPLKWHFLPSSAAGEGEKQRGAVAGSSRVMCVRSQLLVKGLSRSSSGSLSTARAALQSSPILWSHTAVVLIGVSPSRAAQRSPRAEGAGLGSCYFSTLCIPFAAVFLCPCCSISSVAGTEKHEHMRKVSGWVWCIHSYYLLKMRSLFIFNFFSVFHLFWIRIWLWNWGREKKKNNLFPCSGDVLWQRQALLCSLAFTLHQSSSALLTGRHRAWRWHTAVEPELVLFKRTQVAESRLKHFPSSFFFMKEGKASFELRRRKMWGLHFIYLYAFVLHYVTFW